MGLFNKDAKADLLGAAAIKAHANGDLIFMARIVTGMTEVTALSTAMNSTAAQVEAVEAAGWRLDNMSWTQAKSGNPIGIFVFRRA